MEETSSMKISAFVLFWFSVSPALTALPILAEALEILQEEENDINKSIHVDAGLLGVWRG